MSKNNLAQLVKRSFVVVTAATGLALILNQTAEPSRVEESKSIETSLYPPEEVFDGFMRSQGWEFLTNNDLYIDRILTDKGNLYKKRGHPKTKSEIAKELGLPENIIEVQPFAYDINKKPIEGFVSVWIRRPDYQRRQLTVPNSRAVSYQKDPEYLTKTL